MEPKFEIRYFADQTMMAEFYRKIAIGPRPLMVVLGAVVYAFFVVRSWWWGILLEMLPTLAMMGIVFTALYFIPDWFTWLNLRQARKQNDNEMPETVVTVGDAIEMQEGMAHTPLNTAGS